MKTVEEFNKEIAGSKELQEELKAASYVRSAEEGEIDDADAAMAAGGYMARPIETSQELP